MGWSGYTINLAVAVSVDAHAGEREERGERLYTELETRLQEACKEVLADPKWAENVDALRIFTNW